MSRSFRYWSRCALVVSLTLLVTFNPAWAGRGLRGWLKKQVACQSCCETVIVCTPAPSCAPGMPACCQPSDCGCYAPEVLPIDCCETGSTVAKPSEAVIPPAAAPQPSGTPAESETSSTDSGVLPQTQGSDISPSDVAPAVVAPLADSAEAPATPEVPSDTPVVDEPKAVEADPIAVEPEAAATEPELPATEPELPATEPELPATEPELPAAEPELPAAEPELPAADDVFGEEAQPATNSDLFDEPKVNEADSTESSDLFGESSEAVPTDPNADEDLFGQQPPPAATESTEDDLFGTPSEPSETAQASDDDLFATPSQPESDADDDLFGEPNVAENVTEDFSQSPETPVQESTESEESPAIPSVDAEDDLFGTPSSEQGKSDEEDSVDLFGLDEERTWRDNTGTFQVDARLVELNPEFVRLLKANGRYCHVPLRRLSVEDRALVELIASTLPPGGSKFVSIQSDTN